MQANIELSLRTREVHQLFERKINRDRLFIQAILHKFNIVINRCNKQEPKALLAYKQMEQKIQALTKQFRDEISRFELLLTRKKIFDGNKISYVVQFRPIITLTNPLAMQLVELIETYDELVATLKLLHLAGCFEEEQFYFVHVKRTQKLANQILSWIMQKKICGE